MIAVAVAVIMAVILLTGGVVADSDVPGTLEFFGVTVRTTSAQIFLTGAICTWALLAATWLLTAGIRRSRERGAELALLRGHALGRSHNDGSAELTGLPDRGALSEHGEVPGRSEVSGGRELPRRLEASGQPEVPGLGKPSAQMEGPRPGKLTGKGNMELPGRGRVSRHTEGPRRGKFPGRTRLPGREPQGRGELAGLLGFAARPGRVVTDGSGSGGRGDRADPGQNPAE